MGDRIHWQRGTAMTSRSNRLMLSLMFSVLISLAAIVALFVGVALELVLYHYHFWTHYYVSTIALHCFELVDAMLAQMEAWLIARDIEASAAWSITNMMFFVTMILFTAAPAYALLTLWERNVALARAVLGVMFVTAAMTPVLVIVVDWHSMQVDLNGFVWLLIFGGPTYLG